MGNLFCSEYAIHRRFDLKGSSLGRTTQKSQSEIDEYTTLKDLDLNFIFRLRKHWFQDFVKYVYLSLSHLLSIIIQFIQKECQISVEGSSKIPIPQFPFFKN